MVEDDKLRQEASKLNRPSAEAIGKFEDYRQSYERFFNYITKFNLVIPYINDEQADAATKNPHFKLMCRLVNFYVLDESKLQIPFIFSLSFH